jgi:hypothetical protein
MAPWLQSTVQGMLNPETADRAIPVTEAQFSKVGDPRYFWIERVSARDEEISNAGLIEEVPAQVDDAGYAWRTSEDGEVLMQRATALGSPGLGKARRAPRHRSQSRPRPGRPPEPVQAPQWLGWHRSLHLAAYGSQQVQDGLEGADGGRGTISKRCKGTATPPRPPWSRLGPSRRGVYDSAPAPAGGAGLPRRLGRSRRQ